MGPLLSTLSPTPTVQLPPPRPLRSKLPRLLTLLPLVLPALPDTPTGMQDGTVTPELILMLTELTLMLLALLLTPMVPLSPPRPLRLLLQRLPTLPLTESPLPLHTPLTLMPTTGFWDLSATLMVLLSPLSPQRLSLPVPPIWPISLKRTN